MPGNKSMELWLKEILNSEKTKKTSAIFLLAGIIICVILLLPPVQGILAAISWPYASLPFVMLAVSLFALCCLYSRKISAFHDSAANSRLISALAIIVFLLVLCFISFFSYFRGWQWLDSDHSSEMILGKLLAKENALVSTNWLYSTEIRLVYQTIFTMPLFKLLGHLNNWALIRSINILLNNLVLFLSYIFMMKQLPVKTKWLLVSGIFLIIPLSLEYWNIVTFGGYYVFFIAQLFCCLGLFFRLKDHEAKGKKLPASLFLFSMLSFILGAQGVRSLLIIYIPLFLACVYVWTGMKPKKYFPLFLGCIGLVFSGSGYAINSLLHFRYSFRSYENMRIDNLFANLFSKLSSCLADLAGFFGLSAGSPLLSARGLFGIAAIIVALLFARAVYSALADRLPAFDPAETDEQVKLKFIPVFFGVSALFNIFIFIIVDQAVIERHFIPFMVLYVPLAAILFEQAEKAQGHLKRTAFFCGILLFMAGQGCLNFQNLAVRDLNSTRKGYIQYLLDNRLAYGFATFFNANLTTELSNGRIELAGLDPRLRSGSNISQFRIMDTLVPVEYFNPSYHHGESFMLLSHDEWDLARGIRSLAGVKPAYEDDNFIVLLYPSAETIYREILDMW